MLDAEYPAGNAGPGTVPLVVSVYSLTTENAVCNSDESLEPDPTFLYEVMKFDKAAMELIVVNSFMTMYVEEDRLPHCPSAVISVRLAFVPEPRPGFPPVLTR